MIPMFLLNLNFRMNLLFHYFPMNPMFQNFRRFQMKLRQFLIQFGLWLC
jgi:hypothetical protein